MGELAGWPCGCNVVDLLGFVGWVGVLGRGEKLAV